MDKDRIKGKVEDIGGRIQRQAGEWTGNEKSQAEGLKHQVKGKARNMAGKARNMAGKVKDAGRGAVDDLNRRDDIDDREKKGAA